MNDMISEDYGRDVMSFATKQSAERVDHEEVVRQEVSRVDRLLAHLAADARNSLRVGDQECPIASFPAIEDFSPAGLAADLERRNGAKK